jgi:hypothetical protein
VRVVVEIIVGAGPLSTQVSKMSGIWMDAGNIGSGARDVGKTRLTVSLVTRNARVQVAICTIHATMYANW